MINRKQYNILDILLVILNLSTTYSYLPYLLFTPKMGINTLIISILTLFYMLFRFRHPFKLRGKNTIFLVYIAIMVTNAVFGLYTKTYSLGLSVLLFQNLLFYYLLLNIYFFNDMTPSFEQRISVANKGYYWYIFYSLFAIVTFFFFVAIFNISPFSNPVNDKAELFLSNIETGYGASNYYFPLNLSVFYESSDIRIPFFQKDGFITGFFHEPHVVGFLSTPAVLFFLGEKKPLNSKKIILCTLFLVCCISASTVNIMSILATIVVYLMIKYKKRILYSFLLIVLVGFVLYKISSFAVFEFIFSKFASESFIDTVTRLTFAFTPRTLLGSNFITYDMFNSYGNEDVGYVICLLNILFLFGCYYRIYFILFKSRYTAIGLGIFYFFLHSVKIGMPTLSLSYLVFIIFVLEQCYQSVKMDYKNIASKPQVVING